MNVATWLERGARQRPDATAIACGATAVRTYEELARRSGSLATALRGRWQLRPGDRVAIAAKNDPCYLEALFAIWWAGLAAVPINAKLHPEEIAWIVEHAEARALFASPDVAGAISGRDLAGVRAVLVLGEPAYEDAAASADAGAPGARDPEDLAWLFYTSGTTGRPKGAMLTHRNLLAMGMAHLADLDPTAPGDSLIHAAPLSHGSGLLALPHVARLGVNVIPESGGFEASEVFALARHWRNASLFAAPTMVRRMVDCPDDVDSATLRTVIWGGAPMLVADTQRALERLGSSLAQLYGQGETPMTITALRKEQIAERDHPRWRERLASAGTPRCAVEVRVVGEDGAPCGPGEAGEIAVRGDTVMAGYWRDESATRRTLRGGWLHTGDVGALSDDGYLTLKDRSKDLIISGGSNIYPREVEEVLATHPLVDEVSVIGRPDGEWGEVVVAYVVGSADAAELDRLCLEHIARFKRPKDYVRVPELPKNNNGKVVKTELRERDARVHAGGPFDSEEGR